MSNIKLFGSDKVKDLVTDTLYGCDDGELYIENNISESFLFDDGVLKNTSFNEHNGFGLRGVKDDLIGYSHSSEFSIDALKEASRTVSTVKYGHNSNSIVDPIKTNNTLYTDKNPLNVKDFSSKIKLLENINNYARNYDSKVKQVSVNLSGSWQKIDILRPSFLSDETVETLSIEFLNSFNFSSKILSLFFGITLL